MEFSPAAGVLRRPEVAMAALPQVARICLKHILFPIDFSPASDAALPFVFKLARIYGAGVHVAHVIIPEPHPRVLSPRISDQETVWDEANEHLDEFTHGPSVGNVHCTSLLESGDLGDVIPSMIREYEIDMVVVGTRGRRGVGRLVMGSKAETIYRSASCPVLTIGPQVNKSEWKLETILCPVDLEGDPEPALDYALALAEDNAAELLVMNSVPIVPWQHRGELEHENCERMRKLLPTFGKPDGMSEPQFLVRWEPAAEAILTCANVRGADLIVMGVRKSRAAGLSSHLPWPVASEVVSRAPCPVLTVRI
jgi:nucleotide-binding universal stress UspA family protein